eukprot:tig00020943_g16261.t1
MPAHEPANAPWADLITNASSHVQHVFQQYVAGRSLDQLRSPQPQGGDAFSGEWSVGNYFLDRIASDASNLGQIPSLNSVPIEMLSSNMLVRFRCMIQDMASPEFYMGLFNLRDAAGNVAVGTCKYSDGLHLPEDCEVDTRTAVMYERLPVLGVSVPGESDWVLHADEEEAKRTEVPSLRLLRERGAAKQKRPLGSDDAGAADDEMTDAPEAADEKRARDAAAPAAAPAAATEPSGESAGAPAAARAHRSAALPSQRNREVVIKLYDEHMEGRFKLNDVVEFVGVLQVPPRGSEAGPSPMEDAWGDEEVSSVSPSLPAIHCVAFRTLVDHNPAAPVPSAPSFAAAAQAARASLPGVRAELVSYLARGLRGDRLAAEYLLLGLVSSVSDRQGETVLGKFSLNLTHAGPELGPDPARRLHALLSSVYPRSALLPLSIASLGSFSMAPSRDPRSNRLQAGFLQLAAGTHLLVDETAMDEGKLQERGVKNLGALAMAMQRQVCAYDWAYYTTEFPLDVTFAVLSHGKSMLPADCRLRIVSDGAAAGEPQPEPSGEWLQAARRYLAIARHPPHFAIDESVSLMVEEDFVRARKEEPKTGPETLHLWLTLARLVALSRGEEGISREAWAHMRALEAERARRAAA